MEADSPGITELLEKRSLELDGSSSVVNQKENRYFGSISQNQNRTPVAERYRQKAEKRRDSGTSQHLVGPPEKRQALGSGLATPTLRPATPNLTHVLQSSSSPATSFTGNAIVQAAVQAIEKTQQMQQGRRTASLKASYEAIHGGGGMNTHEIFLGRDLTGSASSSSSNHGLQSVERDVSFSAAATASGSSQQKRYKKKMSQGGTLSAHSPSMLQLSAQNSNDSDEMVPTSYINKDGMVVEQTPDGEWTYDPNEPRYCICNQVSYGEMVACDNAEVSKSHINFKESRNKLKLFRSALSSGFIILALASLPLPKANGTVQCKYKIIYYCEKLLLIALFVSFFDV